MVLQVLALFSYIAGGKDRLLEWWKDEFLSPEDFILEDKNSWYKCPKFVDMIVMGGHLFYLQSWHLLCTLSSGRALYISQGDHEVCAGRWLTPAYLQLGNYCHHLGICLKA